MALEHYVRKGSQQLRYGYTTGTCAALAAGGATRLLLMGRAPSSLSLLTGKGIVVEVGLEEYGIDEGSAWAGVYKDAGDDSDITDGMLICARAERSEEDGVSIEGGKGVGRVTKEGLDQPVGNAAINSGPREMIRKQVSEICSELGYDGGIKVTVFIPEGERAAEKTFNPNLGIEGGLSILGTTGIVEPMSQQALVETIELEMKQDGLVSDCIILTPGNYGIHYIEEKGLDGLEDEKGNRIPVLKFSNFLGETLDMMPVCGIQKAIVVGHAGKILKAAAGVMNTHSSWADCRREIICSYCAVCGGDRKVCSRIMEAATTDACFDILDEAGLLEDVVGEVMKAIQSHLDHRTGGLVRTGAVMFSNVRGTLGITDEADKLMIEWKAGEKGVLL